MSSVRIVEGVSMETMNTLRLPAKAEFFAELESLDQVPELIAFAKQRELPIYVLGGGSNLVLAGDLTAVVVKVVATDITPLQETEAWVDVSVDAGCVWHTFLQFCLQRGWHGFENLALIPGTVGAAPVQNIGAYGVEQCDLLQWVEAVDLASGELVRFDRQALQFGYRRSYLKDNPGRYLIWRVVYRMKRQFSPTLGYQGLITDEESPLTPETLFQRVCSVRRSKLPDPLELPNAGSFFENPVVDSAQLSEIQDAFPDLVFYPLSDGRAKLAAGWMLDRAGWKGVRKGAFGTFHRQALVMVHHGHSDGTALLSFAGELVKDVKAKFGVELKQEPVIWPF